MSVNRPTRGVPLPSFWQVLGLAAVVCAVIWLSQKFPRQSESAPEQAAGLGAALRNVEELSARGPDAVPELVALLGSNDRQTRRMALYGLGLQGANAGAALDAVRERLSGDDVEFRTYAFSAFVQICRDPDDLWLTTARMLADPDPTIRETATRLLEGTTPSPIATPVIPDVRERNAARLQESRAVIASVLPMAGSENASTRALVIKVACRRDAMNDDPSVTEMLRGLLDDPDTTVRVAAIVAFAARGAAQVDQVRAWLRASNPQVVNAALDGVRWLGPEREEALPELLALVDKIPGGDLPGLLAALRSMKTLSKPAVAGLMRRLETLEIRVVSSSGYGPLKPQRNTVMEVSRRLESLPALLEMGAELDDMLSLLEPWLQPDHPMCGRQAASILARYRPDEARRHAARMIEQLEQGPSDTIPRVLQDLCGLGPAARDAVPVLIRLIERQNPKGIGIEYFSVETLGCIGPDAAAAVPCLVSRLDLAKADLELSTRHPIIVQTLGKIGPAARPAVPALLKILDLPPPPEQVPGENIPLSNDYRPPYRDVNTALGQIGDGSERVLSSLRRQFDAPGDAQRRATAIKSLVLLCRNRESILADLVRVLDDDSPVVRLLAVRSIPTAGNRPLAIGGLTQALHDLDPWVVSAAALSLGRTGPEAAGATPALRELAAEVRNETPNGIRIPYGTVSDLKYLSSDDDARLARLSVAAAARQALEAIVPAGEGDREKAD
ncbi:MAG: HEAT repeat domain-containing protein [Planctomycetia bacterium]|nr:HEAT repeat domain-containing protein [Planctomycetia bacterium]